MRGRKYYSHCTVTRHESWHTELPFLPVFANREDAEPVKKITVPIPRTNLRRVKDI